MSIKVTLRNRKNAMKSLSKDLHAKYAAITALKKIKMIRDLRHATPIDTGEARAGWANTSTGIVNPVEHIEVLNHGSSKQAPSHFIEKTLLMQKDVKPSGIIVRYK